MEILCIGSDVCFPGSYAGTTHLWNIANAFKRLNNNVSILVSKSRNEKNFEEINGIKIYRIKRKKTKIGSFSLFLRTFLKVLEIIKKEKIDLVYERARILGGGGCLAAKLLKIKSLLELNDPIADAPVLEQRVKKYSLTHILGLLSEKFMFSLANKIITQHKIMAKRAKKNKILVVTNAADPEKFNPKNFSKKEIRKKHKIKKSFLLIYVGSFCKWHLCDSIVKIPILNKKIKVIMVGGGETLKKCKNIVERFGLNNNVIFTGAVNSTEIPKYIAAADACISLVDMDYKPFKELGYYFSPIKIFEYMSMEKPVISTNIENIRKFLNDAGLFVKPNNLKDLNSKINMLFSNSKKRRQMGKKGRELILKKYNWDEIAKKTLEGLK